MIIVYVWSFRGKNEAWGHASMKVDNTYISWWPASPGQVPSKLNANIYDSSPYRNRTFQQDEQDELQPPDHIIKIEGLDEQAVKDWWSGFGLVRNGTLLHGPLQSWNTLKRNCSTVVATALKVGGGDSHASWHKSWNLVWQPNDVLRYAKSIQSNIKK